MSFGLLDRVLDRRAIGIAHRDQKIGEIGVGAVIVGSQFNRAVQFLKGAIRIAQLEKVWLSW